ncbi:MAG: exosome complex exonuclease Rrp41, partial [Thermoplasmatales archaeon]|nr:exosome complex exonuclease Rrp41 [Thermoplasmatales archaeon]
SIDVNIEVLDAEAGTRCAGLTAAAVALADAGIPMRDIPVSCAAGKIEDQIVLDLGKEEDNYGAADLPVAISPRTGEILLLQMDGHLTLDEFDKALDLAIKGCHIVSDIQKKALLEKYQSVPEGQ